MDQTAVIVAAFGAVGLIGASTLPVLLSRSARRAVDEVRDAVGKNGKSLHDRLDELLADELRWRKRTATVLDEHTNWQIAHDLQARARDAAIAEIRERLAR